jgi:hypothetical protein
VSTGDPAIDAAFNGAGPGQVSGTTGDAVIDAAFAPSHSATEGETDIEKLHDAEARHGVLDQEPMDVSALAHPWQSLGRMAVGAATDLTGFIPFAGSGIADAIRRHTQSIQPQDQAEQIGAAGIDASLPLLTMGTGASPKPKESLTAEQVLAQQAGKSQTNMGAAAAAPNLTNVSPELKQAIVQAAQKTGGAVSPDVLARHIEADSLPVKVQLTEGQATQDPNILSNEVNSRAKNSDLATRYNLQNQQLGDNLQALRDQVGPDVFSTNPVEHGDTLIQSYQAKGAAADANISGLYDNYRQAAGGSPHLDTTTFGQDVTNALKPGSQSQFLPSTVQNIIQKISDPSSNLSLDDFEAYTKQLAAEARKADRAGDGNAQHAIGVVRDQVEALQPTSDQSETALAAYRDARNAAKTQFDITTNKKSPTYDPAYAAALDGSVPPDRFVSKFITGPTATRDGVATMKANLADDPTATQTMGVAAIDHLRTQAKVGDGQSGNFAAERYNNAFRGLSPKIPSLFNPQTAEQLSTVGNVARYVKAQPAGSYVNNSNTFTALAGEHAKSALEGAVNVAAKGVPVGTWIRKAAQGRAEAAETQKALAPGAGLTRLSDIANPK